jgi:dTDP-4-dehydrorhamnose 3,5-epimerase
MKKHNTHIDNCFWIEPDMFEDHRGIFSEIFKNSSTEHLFKPLQSNYSFSKKGVLRGIHRTPYAKYVTCVKGTVYDVCVDLRPHSKTHNQHFGICLSEVVLNSLYIPPFCGHAFLALEDSILIYQQNQEYNPKLDEAYCYKDYDIKWPSEIIYISDKDKNICNIR